MACASRVMDDDTGWITVSKKCQAPSSPAVRLDQDAASSRPESTSKNPGARRKLNHANRRRNNTSRSVHADSKWSVVVSAHRALEIRRQRLYAASRLSQINTTTVECGWKPERSRQRSRQSDESRGDASAGVSRAVAKGTGRLSGRILPKFAISLSSAVDFPILECESGAHGEPTGSGDGPSADYLSRSTEPVQPLDDRAAKDADGLGRKGDIANQGDCGRISCPEEHGRCREQKSGENHKNDAWFQSRRYLTLDQGQSSGSDIMEQHLMPTEGLPVADLSSRVTFDGRSHLKSASNSKPDGTSRTRQQRAASQQLKREHRVLQQRLCASRDTHIQLVSSRFIDRCRRHTRRRQNPNGHQPPSDLTSRDQYPELGVGFSSPETAADHPDVGGSSAEAAACKSYCRTLLEVPRLLEPLVISSTPDPVSSATACTPASSAAKTKKQQAGSRIELDLSSLIKKSNSSVQDGAEDGRVGGITASTLNAEVRSAQRRARIDRRLQGRVLPRRGKTREQPRAKKPTRLKRLVLRARAERAAIIAAKNGGNSSPVVSGADDVEKPADGALSAGACLNSDGGATEGCSEAITDFPDCSAASETCSADKYSPEPTHSQSTRRNADNREENFTNVDSEPTRATNVETDVKCVTCVDNEDLCAIDANTEDKIVLNVEEEDACVTNVYSKDTCVGNVDTGDYCATNVYGKEQFAVSVDIKQGHFSEDNETCTTDLHQADASLRAEEKCVANMGGENSAVNNIDTEAVCVGNVTDDKNIPTSKAKDEEIDSTQCLDAENQSDTHINAKSLLHSNKFRDYCEQMPRAEINAVVTVLLQDLCRFQERQYLRDPIKARSRRRLVFGLKEVIKRLSLNKLKCVILAPNIENVAPEGGLNSMVQTLLTLAGDGGVPVVVALRRRPLGKCCHKPVPVSCVGVLDYQGSEENFKQMLALTRQAQLEYAALLSSTQHQLQQSQLQCQSISQTDIVTETDDVPASKPSDTPTTPSLISPPSDPNTVILDKLKHISI